MAPHEGDDDPAVYRSSSKTKKPTVADEDAGEEDDDDALLTVQPGFNKLLLVLRDEGIMRFVKYVSALANGSRWDVSGEYSLVVDETD